MSATAKYILYYNIITEDLYDENGSYMGNSAFNVFFDNTVNVELHYMTDTSSDDMSNWIPWTGLQGNTTGSSICFDDDYLHASLGSVSEDSSVGSTILKVSSTLSENNVNPSDSLILYTADGGSVSLPYTGYTYSSGVYSFELASALSTTASTGLDVRVPQALLLKVYSDEIDQTEASTGVFKFSMNVLSHKLLNRLDYSNTTKVSGMFEHQIYSDGNNVATFTFPMSVTNLIDYRGNANVPADGTWADKAYVDSKIPTKVSELQNDAGYISEQTDPVYTADKPSIALKQELFSKSFNDLSDVPNTIAGYGITDVSINDKIVTIGQNSIEVPEVTADTVRTALGIDTQTGSTFKYLNEKGNFVQMSSVLSVNGVSADINGDVSLNLESIVDIQELAQQIKAVKSVNGVFPDDTTLQVILTANDLNATVYQQEITVQQFLNTVVTSVNQMTPTNGAITLDASSINYYVGGVDSGTVAEKLQYILSNLGTGAVRTINGQLPDPETGNIQIAFVKSVDGFTPNANGQVQMTITMDGTAMTFYDAFETLRYRIQQLEQGGGGGGSTQLAFNYPLSLDGNVVNIDMSFSNVMNTPTTLDGYGITDAYINGRTITLGSVSIEVPQQGGGSTAYTFTSPLSVDANNTVSIDLSDYITSQNIGAFLYAQNISYLSSNVSQELGSLSQRIQVLQHSTSYTFTQPLSVSPDNVVSIDLSNYVRSQDIGGYLFAQNIHYTGQGATNVSEALGSLTQRITALQQGGGSGQSYTFITPLSVNESNEVSVDLTSYALKSDLFSKSFNDLTDKPTTLVGYGITDANINGRVITLGGNSIEVPEGGSTYVLTKAAVDEVIGASATGSATKFYNQRGEFANIDLTEYATKTFVTNQGYITVDALSGYATTTDVSTAVSNHNTATDAHTALFNGKENVGVAQGLVDNHAIITASDSVLGHIKVDNDTITVDENGVATAHAIGHNIFDIFYSMSSKTPAGAMDLSLGTLIASCNTVFPDFWNECLQRRGNTYMFPQFSGSVYYRWLGDNVIGDADLSGYDSAVCYYNGKIYILAGVQCDGHKTPPPQSQEWRQFIVPTEQWDAQRQYSIGGTVLYNGQIWCAKAYMGSPIWAGIGIAPGTTDEDDYHHWARYDLPTQIIEPSIRLLTESQWQAEVTANGSCGAFVVDETAMSVRLPKITHMIQPGDVGVFTKAGLPNIAGNLSIRPFQYAGSYYTVIYEAGGAFALSSKTEKNIPVASSNATFQTTSTLSFSAKASNSIYGNSTTVQPPTVGAKLYIQVYTSAVPASVAQASEFINMLEAKADKTELETKADRTDLTAYLPLAGGTMTGITRMPEYAIRAVTDTDAIRIYGGDGDDSAGIFLFGKNRTGGIAGRVYLNAQIGTNFKHLILDPDGTFTWDGVPVLNPIGTVIAFAGNSAPAGYLICNGAAVSRTTYAKLFAVIGTTYGAGNGSSTFNLPNLTNRFIMGSGTAGTVKSAGLPNITGSFEPLSRNSDYPTSGAFYYKTAGNGQSDANSKGAVFGFDASRSSSIYGNSTTVQPPALTMRFYIKY